MTRNCTECTNPMGKDWTNPLCPMCLDDGSTIGSRSSTIDIAEYSRVLSKLNEAQEVILQARETVPKIREEHERAMRDLTAKHNHICKEYDDLIRRMDGVFERRLKEAIAEGEQAALRRVRETLLNKWPEFDFNESLDGVFSNLGLGEEEKPIDLQSIAKKIDEKYHDTLVAMEDEED